MPADHEARSQVKVRKKSSAASKKALTGGLKRSRDRTQRCGNARATMQETWQNQKKRAQQIASVIENFTPCTEALTPKLANRPDSENSFH